MSLIIKAAADVKCSEPEIHLIYQVSIHACVSRLWRMDKLSGKKYMLHLGDGDTQHLPVIHRPFAFYFDVNPDKPLSASSMKSP